MILLTIFCIFGVSFIHGEKLHEYMTKEEIESVFQIKHDSVHKLEYELIPIFHFRKSTRKNLKTLYIPTTTQNYTLYLKTNDHLVGTATPVYKAQANIGSDGKLSTEYKRTSYPDPTLQLYHDVANEAALAVHTDHNNRQHIDGIIGDKLIRSLPSRIHDSVLTEYQNVFGSSSGYDVYLTFADESTDDPTIDRPVFHVAIDSDIDKINTSAFEFDSDDKVAGDSSVLHDQLRENQELTLQAYLSKYRSIGKPINSLKYVYPQILVIIDYNTAKLYQNDVGKITKYMAAFWNAVDLRFRELKNPKVRLNIAGLIIPESENALPYTAIYKQGFLYADAIINATQAHFDEPSQSNKTFPYDTYDLIASMSNVLYGVDLDNNKGYETEMTGGANLGGACGNLRSEKKVAVTAVIQDAGFNGITTAAHELAHLFGTPHDDLTSASIPGGPCNWNGGYLMTYRRSDIRGIKWSECSKKAMEIFFNSKNATCLTNVPNVGKPFARILPGRVLSRDEQCMSITGTRSHKKGQSHCIRLLCVDPDPEVKREVLVIRPVAEGTACGENKICLDGLCVQDSPADFD